MEYIENILGLKVSQHRWEEMSQMPFYLQDRYNIQRATIGAVSALFLFPKAELEHISALQKHIDRIQKEAHLPIAVVLPEISRYRRNALIEAKIAFVVPGKQLYLPFMGVYLQERFDQESVKVEQFQPATQVLFFYYLYKKEKNLHISQAVKDLGYSAMTISRAAKQLVQTGYFTESKEGVQKILTAMLGRRELFEKMRPMLINPVRRKTYIKKEDLTEEYILAGDTAIAKLTMINDSMFRCYAVVSKQAMVELPAALYAQTDVQVELWKYDPKLLSSNGMVDPLSLAMSFADEEDERIQGAIEELLDRFWED